MRKSMMGLVHKGKDKVRGSGFLVTWDVDSADRSATYRMWSILFGRTLRVDGREYAYEDSYGRTGSVTWGSPSSSSCPIVSPRSSEFWATTGSTTKSVPAFSPEAARKRIPGGPAEFTDFTVKMDGSQRPGSS